MSDFDLKEKRNEIRQVIIDWWFSDEGQMTKSKDLLLKKFLEIVDKQDKEFIRRLKEELNPLDFDKGDNYTTTIAEQNARIDKLSGFEDE